MKKKSSKGKTNVEINSVQNMSLKDLTDQELKEINGGCNNASTSAGAPVTEFDFKPDPASTGEFIS